MWGRSFEQNSGHRRVVQLGRGGIPLHQSSYHILHYFNILTTKPCSSQIPFRISECFFRVFDPVSIKSTSLRDTFPVVFRSPRPRRCKFLISLFPPPARMTV